jgi:hypothetical protein
MRGDLVDLDLGLVVLHPEDHGGWDRARGFVHWCSESLDCFGKETVFH